MDPSGSGWMGDAPLHATIPRKTPLKKVAEDGAVHFRCRKTHRTQAGFPGVMRGKNAFHHGAEPDLDEL